MGISLIREATLAHAVMDCTNNSEMGYCSSIQARNTTFTILTIKLFYAKIKREPNKHGELEK